MSQLTSVTIFIILSLHCSQGFGDRGSGKISGEKNEVATRGNNHLGLEKERSARFLMNPFSIFNIVQFPNTHCNTTDMRHGTCYTSSECSAKGGTSQGRCSQGFGVCCLFEDDCQSIATENGTYFISPSNPRSTCEMTIRKLNDDICQVRIDFEELALRDPDVNGLCDEEYVQVQPSTTMNVPTIHVPRLCGNLNGQHVIFSPHDSVPTKLSVVLHSTTVNANGKMWRMKVTQFSCNSPDRAPPGCLQYYTGVKGSVSSFNYKDADNNNPANMGTPKTFPNHISNLNYNICLRQELGYCSVEWSTKNKNKKGLFSLTGDRTTNANTALTLVEIKIGTNINTITDRCQNDYVMIPQGEMVGNTDADLRQDRYCGQGLGYCKMRTCNPTSSTDVALGPVSSSVLPFTLGVVTDNVVDNTVDKGIRGFMLNYKQHKCV